MLLTARLCVPLFTAPNLHRTLPVVSRRSHLHLFAMNRLILITRRHANYQLDDHPPKAYSANNPNAVNLSEGFYKDIPRFHNWLRLDIWLGQSPPLPPFPLSPHRYLYKVSGLLAMKAAVIALIAMAFGLSVANAQQTGLLLSQVCTRIWTSEITKIFEHSLGYPRVPTTLEQLG